MIYTQLTHGTELHGSTKNMVKKAKTYGKKGANSLSDAFNKLSISTSPQQGKLSIHRMSIPKADER